MPADKTAMLSGGLGILAFVISILITLWIDSYTPFLLGMGFMIVAILWKPIFDWAFVKQTKVQAANIVETYAGTPKLEEMRTLLQQFDADRPIYDGAELYIKTLKYYLAKQGVHGMHEYTPKNFQTFEPYGLFVMEIEPDDLWNRPRMYSMLSISGPNAGTHVGTIYAMNWRQAVDIIAEQGSTGLLPAKLMELKSPLMKAALENSMQRQMMEG